MKVIDLLNKIANGEETHFDTKLNGKCVVVRYFNDREFSTSTDPEMLTIADIIKSLNDEVEIIEEDKKIPEKIDEEFFEAISSSYRDRIMKDKIDEIIDYLEDKQC